MTIASSERVSKLFKQYIYFSSRSIVVCFVSLRVVLRNNPLRKYFGSWNMRDKTHQNQFDNFGNFIKIFYSWEYSHCWFFVIKPKANSFEKRWPVVFSIFVFNVLHLMESINITLILIYIHCWRMEMLDIFIIERKKLK